MYFVDRGREVGRWVLVAGRVAELDLSKGRHVLTLSVGTATMGTVLAVELQDIAGSPAQVQIVGGK